MVGLVGSHDLLNCKDSCFRYKIVDIKRELGRETGFPLFFLIRSPKKNYSAPLATVFFSAIRAFLPVSLRK